MDRTVDIRQSRSAVVLRVLTLRVLLTLEYNIVRTQHLHVSLYAYLIPDFFLNFTLCHEQAREVKEQGLMLNELYSTTKFSTVHS